MARRKLEWDIVANDKASRPIDKAEKSIKDLGRAADKSEKDMSGLWKSMAGGAIVASGVIAGMRAASRAVTGFIGDSIELFKEQEKVEAQLNAVIKSTGQAAGLTATEIKKMASSLQGVTTFGDEAIIKGQNLLLTFKSIGKETFPRATEAMLDMSTAMGQDLKSSAVQLGKALQDPITGLAALRRVGIQFTAEQENMIKSLVKSGDLMKAQSMILDELESQFGGSARAAAETLSGQFEQMGNIIGDVKEEFGEAFLRGILPMLQEAKTWVEQNRGAISQFAEDIARHLQNVIKLAKEAYNIFDTFTFGKALKQQERETSGWLNQIKVLQDRTKQFYEAHTGGAKAARDELVKLRAEFAKKHELTAWGDDLKKAKLTAKELEYINERLKDFGVELTEQIQKQEDTAADIVQHKEEESATVTEILELTKEQQNKVDGLLGKYFKIEKSLEDQIKEEYLAIKATGIRTERVKKLEQAYNDILANAAEQNEIQQEAIKAAEDAADMLVAQNDIQQDANILQQENVEAAEDAAAMIAAQNEEVEKNKTNWDKVAETVMEVNGYIQQGIGFLADMGIMSEEAAGAVSQLIGGGATLAAGIMTGDVGSIVSGGLQFLSGVVDTINALDYTMTDEMIDNLGREGILISEEMAERLEETAEAVGDHSVALAMHLGEIIDQGQLTADNFDAYVNRVVDTFHLYNQGAMTAAEATAALDDSFDSLVAQAQRLGIEGAASMAEVINYARAGGLQGPEMLRYLETQYQNAFGAMTAHIDGTADSQEGFNAAMRQTMALFQGMQADGKSATEILQLMGPTLDKLKEMGVEQGFSTSYLSDLFGMQEFYKDNEELLNSLTATQTVMESLANAGLLGQERFDEFNTSMQDYYDKLIENKASEEEAMQAIFPMLAKQAWYAQQYGYELDEGTKKLIEQAKQQGLNLENAIPAEERMAEAMDKQTMLLERLVELFGGELPYAIDATANAFSNAADQAGRLGTNASSAAAYSGQFSTGGPQAPLDPNKQVGPLSGYATGTNGWQPIESSFITGEKRQAERVDLSGDKMRITPLGEPGGGQTINLQFVINNTGAVNIATLKNAIRLNAGKIGDEIRAATRNNRTA